MKIMMANFSKMVGDSGGVAKVNCAFANEMIKRGHSVSIIYADENVGNFFFPVDKTVRLYNLRLKEDGTIIKFPFYYRIVRELYRIFSRKSARNINNKFNEKKLLGNLVKYVSIEQPDIIVSYQLQASKMLLCDLKTDIPVITMSHGDPEDYFHTYPDAEIPSLEKSTVCQVLMPSFENKIKAHIGTCNTITIGNAIPQFDFSANLKAEKTSYKIIFVGRLVKNHKRPHILVEAFGKIAKRYPEWQVELWGMTDRKSYITELNTIIKRYGIEDRVHLMGPTDQVPQKLKNADIFAFPSAYEGFGMALAEGMSVGLPSVGFKSCPAVNELIIDNKTGILCDDGVDAFASALERLMRDRLLRVEMGAAAKEDMKQYAPDRIWDKWESLMLKYKK